MHQLKLKQVMMKRRKKKKRRRRKRRKMRKKKRKKMIRKTIRKMKRRMIKKMRRKMTKRTIKKKRRKIKNQEKLLGKTTMTAKTMSGKLLTETAPSRLRLFTSRVIMIFSMISPKRKITNFSNSVISHLAHNTSNSKMDKVFG